MKLIQQPARAIMAVCAALVLTERAPVQAEGNRQTAGRIVVWGRDADRYADSKDDLVAIAAGWYHGLAVRKDGTVVGWGAPWHVPPGLSDIVSVAGGSSSGALYPNHSLGLRRDGTVLTWGNVVSEVAGLTDVIAIASGSYHRLVLKRDGAVVAWGADGIGQSTVPEGLIDVVAIAAGAAHSLALKNDGTVVAWGHNEFGEGTPPAGLTDAIAIAAGNHHNLALRRDGTVVAWGGENRYGELNVPPDLHEVTAVAAGAEHCLALRLDGTVVAWGAGKTRDGSLYEWGQSIVPDGLEDVIAISAGVAHSMALVAVHKPLLDVQRSDVHLRVAWPQSLTGYQLEMTDDLSNGSWISVPDAPVIENSEHVVTRELSGSSRFFRLRQE